MNISIFFAQMLGTMFVVLGLSMIFNKKWTAIAVDEMTKNQGIIWLAGLITLILGVTIVGLNNIWTSGLSLFITILGWLTLIKGITILVFPNFSFSYYKKMNRGNIFVWGGFVVLIFGLILLYSVFM
jgi:hypothetical protein